jgi:O-antigen ligase/polysaccharide polymerase Wzy-like membrane protein
MSILNRRPVWALHVLIVGLALHNLVMSQLYRAGVHGTWLSAISAWKDVLLVGALAVVVWARRRRPFELLAVDWLALVFGAFVVVYALIPQSVLGGGATHKGVLYGTRHDLLAVLAYFLGRGLELTQAERSRLCQTVLFTAAAVAVYGLIDVYFVPLSWWRQSSGWFSDQLGLTYHGLSGLPENFVYNEGGGVIFRRLTSTFLSPLATGYLLVVALFCLPLRGRRWAPPVAALLLAALLATHTRAALLALVGGLLVIAALRRAVFPAALAVLVAVLGFAFVKAYDHLGPRTHFTPTELAKQEANAHQHPDANHDATSANESSASEHFASFRAGLRTAIHHPQGFGIGNAGVTAERTNVTVEAGESTYTELAVETGLLGGLAFIAWSVALLGRLRHTPWLAGAFAAMLFVGLQTDVIGIPWIAVVVWALAGAELSRNSTFLQTLS